MVGGKGFDRKEGNIRLDLELIVRQIRAVTSRPLVAIGGITSDRVSEILAAGADGVCVASAILLAPDPRAAAASFARELGLQAS